MARKKQQIGSELEGQEAFARAMQLKLEGNRKARGEALRRGLEDEILADFPRLTREKLREFMKEA